MLTSSSGVISFGQYAEAPARTLAHPLPRLLLKEVRLVVQSFCGDQALDKEVHQLHEETELLIQGRYEGQAPDIDGKVFINDKDVFAQSPNAIAAFRNKSVGFVFQFHNLLPEFSALENVMIPGLIGNTKDSIVKSKATDLLKMLGLGERMEHKPSELSGGEQQRTAVARALINSPMLLLADEPSGNLDSRNAVELHQLFFKLRSEMGQTFVIVTHNEELAQMADRRLEIKDGMIRK